MAIVYDNTRKIMECGLPYTLPLTLFTSSLKKGIEQPGEYFITVAVQDVGYQSVVFRVEE